MFHVERRRRSLRPVRVLAPGEVRRAAARGRCSRAGPLRNSPRRGAARPRGSDSARGPAAPHRGGSRRPTTALRRCGRPSRSGRRLRAVVVVALRRVAVLRFRASCRTSRRTVERQVANPERGAGRRRREPEAPRRGRRAGALRSAAVESPGAATRLATLVSSRRLSEPRAAQRTPRRVPQARTRLPCRAARPRRDRRREDRAPSTVPGAAPSCPDGSDRLAAHRWPGRPARPAAALRPAGTTALPDRRGMRRERAPAPRRIGLRGPTPRTPRSPARRPSAAA